MYEPRVWNRRASPGPRHGAAPDQRAGLGGRAERRRGRLGLRGPGDRADAFARRGHRLVGGGLGGRHEVVGGAVAQGGEAVQRGAASGALTFQIQASNEPWPERQPGESEPASEPASEPESAAETIAALKRIEAALPRDRLVTIAGSIPS